MKKLHRIPSRGQVSGVCAGLSDYLNIDVTIVRIAFIIGILLGGTALIAYLLLWILLPVQPKLVTNMGETIYEDVSYTSASSQPSSQGTTYSNFDPATSQFTMENEQNTSQSDANERWTSSRDNSSKKPVDSGSKTVGFILVAIGVVFLANQLIPDFDWDYVWPAMLIAIGGYLLFKR